MSFKVNFGRQQYPTQSVKRHRGEYRQNYSQQITKDEFTPSRRTKKHHKSKSNNHLAFKTFLAGVAATMITNGAISCSQNSGNLKPVNVPVYRNTSISEIADLYNSDESIIYLYNDIDENSDLDNLKSINVPQKYDYTGTKIENLQQSLYSNKLTPEERNNIEEKIKSLKETKENQDNLANVYTDGKYIYYSIKYDSQDKSQSINVEDFKNLFSIKDGFLKDYNNISFKYDTNEYGSYQDYTGANLYSGEVIKIPMNGIKK